jgi:transcriptional regulator with XRE-family HTH domain
MRINQLNDVGALLKSRRKNLMLSQAELGNRIGLSQERVSAIENHPEKVTLDNLFTYLMALDIKLDLTLEAPKRRLVFRGANNDRRITLLREGIEENFKKRSPKDRES